MTHHDRGTPGLTLPGLDEVLEGLLLGALAPGEDGIPPVRLFEALVAEVREALSTKDPGVRETLAIAVDEALAALQSRGRIEMAELEVGIWGWRLR